MVKNCNQMLKDLLEKEKYKNQKFFQKEESRKNLRI